MRFHFAVSVSIFSAIIAFSSCKTKSGRQLTDPAFVPSSRVLERGLPFFENYPRVSFPRIINFGHTVPDTLYFKNNLHYLENNSFLTGQGVQTITPFYREKFKEGSVYYAKNDWSQTDDPWFVLEKENGEFWGPKNLSWYPFFDKTMKFGEEHVKAAIEDVQSIKNIRSERIYFPIQNFRHGQFDWFDDEEWATVANNMEWIAKVMQAGAYEGIIFDNEEYGNGAGVKPPGSSAFWTWKKKGDPGYVPALETFYKGKTFEQVAEKARERGRDFIRIINKYNPKTEILILFAYSQVSFSSPDTLEDSVFGIFARFMDGMLEASTEETTFVDLCEGSYTQEKWGELILKVKNKGLFHTKAPEDYKKKVKFGFPVYRNWETPEDFERIIREGLVLSNHLNDGEVSYLWVYSENQLHEYDGHGSWIMRQDDKAGPIEGSNQNLFSSKKNVWIAEEYQKALNKAWNDYTARKTLVYDPIEKENLIALSSSDLFGYRLPVVLEGPEYAVDILNIDPKKAYEIEFLIKDGKSFVPFKQHKTPFLLYVNKSKVETETGPALRLTFRYTDTNPAILSIKLLEK